MSTPNFKTQRDFDLYVTNDFLQYPYELDENDDFVLDTEGNPIINYDVEPFFDYSYFDECKNYTDNNLNSKLAFFTISFADGYYQGVQARWASLVECLLSTLTKVSRLCVTRLTCRKPNGLTTSLL